MDKTRQEALEDLKYLLLDLDEVGLKKIETVVSALRDPEHPLHDDITAISRDAGKTPQQKNEEILSLLEPIH
jgi:hypothetical protein